MSRSSSLVVVGSLWTLISILTFFRLCFPTLVHADSEIALVAYVVLGAFSFQLAAASGLTHVRLMAFTVHLAIPLFWGSYLVYFLSSEVLPMSAWIGLSSMAFVGGLICDRGVELILVRQLNHPRRETQTIWDSGAFLTPVLRARDSGAFARPVVVTDSGVYICP